MVLNGNVGLADAAEPAPDVAVLPDTVGLADTAEQVPDVAVSPDTLHEADSAEQVRDNALLTGSVVVSVESGEPDRSVAVQRSGSHVRWGLPPS